uniref:EF-hand domain-containing protein n=1 Tax=Parascaris univalens TaxID=6257 RepID=A0A914ZIW8_PARUN
HDDLAELMKWEINVQPPPIEELRRLTSGAFSSKWIKYAYAKFKNECPSGRMRIQEFRNLFGAYLPSRVSNAYMHRLFFAFSRSQETLTFQELVETLAMLNSPTPLSNAHWTMRLIKGSDDGTISYTDFKDFVHSVFSETNKELRKISTASTAQKKTPTTPSTQLVDNGIDKRAVHVFSRLDRNNDGFIELDDLIDFFQREDRVDPLGTCSRSVRMSHNK